MKRIVLQNIIDDALNAIINEHKRAHFGVDYVTKSSRFHAREYARLACAERAKQDNIDAFNVPAWYMPLMVKYATSCIDAVLRIECPRK